MNHVYQFRDVWGPVKGVNSQLVCFCMAWWLERNLALNFPTSSQYINLGILNILGIIEQISVQQFYLTKQKIYFPEFTRNFQYYVHVQDSNFEKRDSINHKFNYIWNSYTQSYTKVDSKFFQSWCDKSVHNIWGYSIP